MAVNGNFTTGNTSGIGAQYPKNATFSWWQNGQSVSGNYTDIGWNFKLGGGSSNNSTIAVYWGCITVDGEYHEFNYGGGWKGNGFVLASGTKRIYHNNNGSKSFSASGAVNIYASSGRQVEGSNSWSLNTIARKVNISSVTGSTTDEDFSPTVKWSNNGNRVDLKLELPDFGINPFKRWNDLQGSSSFRPTLTQAEKNQIMAKIPNGTTTKIRFTILTMIGGSEAFYDFIDKTFTIVNGEPSFSNFDYYDTNSATTAITGNNKILISGKSRLNVKISSANKAVARKSANMSSYSASLSGISSSANYASSDVNIAWGNNDFSSGSQTLTVRAHDSRGFSRAVSKNVTVIPYSNPDVAAKATRLNNFENQTTLHIEGKFSTVSVNNVVKNTIQSVQYRYKAQSTTSWGSWTNMAGLKVNGDRFTTNDVTLNLDNSKSYDFQVSVRDKLTTVTPSLTVSVGIPIFRIGTDGYVYNQERRVLKAGDDISNLTNDKGYLSSIPASSVGSSQIATNAVGWDEFNTSAIMPKISSARYTDGDADETIPTSWYNAIRVDVPSPGKYIFFGVISVNAMGGHDATVHISMDIIDNRHGEETISGGWARQVPFLFIVNASQGSHYIQLKRTGGNVAITFSWKRTSVGCLRIG